MRILALLVCVLCLGGAFRSTSRYAAVFGSDYTAALRLHKRYAQQRAQAWQHLPEAERRILQAALFPELIRYSLLKDFFETQALAYGYVHHGAEAVDFSVGIFQMKPSFAERIETMLTANDSLARCFGDILPPPRSDIKAARQQRVNRLQNVYAQLRYAAAFWELVRRRFPAVPQGDAAEQVRFVAAAYNSGFHRDSTFIGRAALQANFPYGTAYKGEQYVYADIALDFYSNH